MIQTKVVLDLTRRDSDTAAQHRRIVNALSSCDSNIRVQLVVDRNAFFDDMMSTIAGLTLDLEVEIVGTDPQAIRQYARLFSTFQAQRRNVEAGVSR